MGELKDANVWPTMRTGNEGGFILTAIHLTQQPKESNTPERNSFKLVTLVIEQQV